MFELQAWVEGGNPLTVPPHYRRTPLRVAIETGFHSLIEFLLQNEADQSAKDQALVHACWTGQRSAMQLALRCGANVGSVSFADVVGLWDREVMRMFLERGADPITNFPFARAFKSRVRSALGGFLDCNKCLQYFDWADRLWLHREGVIPESRRRKSLDALCFLLEQGARWMPDRGEIANVRRAFCRVEGEVTIRMVDLLRRHRACDEEVLREFLRTPKMQTMLASVRGREAFTERRATRWRQRRPDQRSPQRRNEPP